MANFKLLFSDIKINKFVSDSSHFKVFVFSTIFMGKNKTFSLSQPILGFETMAFKNITLVKMFLFLLHSLDVLLQFYLEFELPPYETVIRSLY